jgi:hypothetical protein
MTPRGRALAHPCVPEEEKLDMINQRNSINPALVAREIHRLRGELYKLAK